MLVSICIVNLNARDYLHDCLQSIISGTHRVSYEIIVVDNHSQDGSVELLRPTFPDVVIIENETNEGFSKPMNKAMKITQGEYILLLNPDTLVQEGAIDYLVDFLGSHPDVGIVGPKVLNPDGSLQKPCRRSEARPWDVFTYFSGLAKRFPSNPRFSGYYLGYLDENQTCEVDGVSGSCMLVRKEVVEQIGYLDERFFAYQEDADFCLRARQAGWKIFYFPEAKVTHFGGKGGSKVEPTRSIVAWHFSYYQYYKKHFASDYFFLFNWFYYSLMGLKLGFSLIKHFFCKEVFAGSRKPG